MSRAVQFVTHELIDGQAVLFTFFPLFRLISCEVYHRLKYCLTQRVITF